MFAGHITVKLSEYALTPAFMRERVMYKVELCACGFECTTWKYYNDFKALHTKLLSDADVSICLPSPYHGHRQNDEFIQTRKVELQRYLEQVFVVCRSRQEPPLSFLDFVGWKSRTELPMRTITVNSVAGESTQFRKPMSARVLEVKEEVQARWGLPVVCQRLICGVHELQDADIVSSLADVGSEIALTCVKLRVDVATMLRDPCLHAKTKLSLPSARHDFPFVSVLDTVLLLGGVLRNGRPSNEIWRFAGGQDFVRGADAMWPARSGHSATLIGDRVLVTGGRGLGKLHSDVWLSSNNQCTAWSRLPDLPFGPICGHRIVYIKRMYEECIVLLGNSVWLSTDGALTWRVVGPSDFPHVQDAIAIGEHIVVFTDTNCYSSRDLGVNWSFEANPWGIRSGFRVVVVGDILVMHGGFCCTGRDWCGDTWMSEDGGRHWQELPHIKDSPRCDYGFGVWQDRLLVAGGLGKGNSKLSDGWLSLKLRLV